MGLFDIIPGISQIKSTVQLVCGDAEGAARTQEKFLKECPVVSQITSTVQLVTGDVDGALETQRRCGQTLMATADELPGVGHAKGLIHYACGDKEGGNRAMEAATSTTGAIAGGAVIFAAETVRATGEFVSDRAGHLIDLTLGTEVRSNEK